MSETLLARADAARLPIASTSVDLVLGSPPYMNCRLYLENGRDLGIARGFEAWVAWMLAVTEEALRVSRGAVVWVAAGSTKDRNYLPACEALMSDWYRRRGGSGVWQDGIELPGGTGSMYRPCYWHRVGVPGSGGDQWFKANIEYCMCFKRIGKLPYSDNTAMGKPPAYGPGGEMSYRDKGGRRRDHPYAVAHTKSRRGGNREPQIYVPPDVSNPGNLINTGINGGGRLGSGMSHENEAPYPEKVPEFFIRSLVPPGGTVLDPFGGSGTTCAVAARTGRTGIGLDLRQSQCLLARRRIADGLRPVSRLDSPKPVKPLAGQLSFLDGA